MLDCSSEARWRDDEASAAATHEEVLDEVLGRYLVHGDELHVEVLEAQGTGDGGFIGTVVRDGQGVITTTAHMRDDGSYRAEGVSGCDGTQPGLDPGQQGFEPDPVDRIEVEVTLYRCGFEPTEAVGYEWVPVETPFDATNAPASWVGRGTLEVRWPVGHYLDGGGEEVDMVALVGPFEPPPCR